METIISMLIMAIPLLGFFVWYLCKSYRDDNKYQDD